MFKHELGIKAKSRISGFTGIITSRAEHLNGCNRYWVEPTIDKEGKLRSGSWIDEDELIRVGTTKLTRGENLNRDGFPSQIK